jgi:hypothetical protein
VKPDIRYFNSVDVHPQLCHKRHQFIFFKVSLPFVLEKAKGTQNLADFIVAQVFQIFPSFTPGERQGNRKLAGLYCYTVNDCFGGKNFMFSKQKFEKYPPWKTVF